MSLKRPKDKVRGFLLYESEVISLEIGIKEVTRIRKQKNRSRISHNPTPTLSTLRYIFYSSSIKISRI